MPNYATITEAQAYLDTRLNVDAWECSTNDDRTRALSMATRIIDKLNFLGCKTDEAQENQFPRNDDTVVPTDVQYASVEIALALLDGVDPQLEYENLHMRSQGYSSVRSTFSRTNPPPHVTAGIPSITAWRYLLPYLRDPHELTLFRVN